MLECVLAACYLSMLSLTGCATGGGPIFEGVHPPLEWPPRPHPPRLRYIGELRQSADLKPREKFGDTLGRIFIGPKKPKPLYGPRSVVTTDDGARLWIADPGGRCVHLFDLVNRRYQRVRTVGDEPLESPVALCVGPPGSIYVSDSARSAIHRLADDSGELLESLRLPEDISRPVSLAYNPVNGELYVVDVVRHDIKVLDRQGRLLRILGGRGSGPGEFNYPLDIALHDGLLWIADSGNHRVQALTPDGQMVTSIGRAGDASGDLALPKGIAFDSDGHLYVVDARFENIQVFDQSGRLLLAIGGEGTKPGEFWLPAGIFIDATDRVWVCDTYNSRIQLFQYLTSPDAEASSTEETRQEK